MDNPHADFVRCQCKSLRNLTASGTSCPCMPLQAALTSSSTGLRDQFSLHCAITCGGRPGVRGKNRRALSSVVGSCPVGHGGLSGVPYRDRSACVAARAPPVPLGAVASVLPCDGRRRCSSLSPSVVVGFVFRRRRPLLPTGRPFFGVLAYRPPMAARRYPSVETYCGA